MIKKITFKAAAGLLVIGVIAAVALSSIRPTNKVATGYRYETEKVTRGAIRKVVVTSGTIRPLKTVQVGSQLSGRVKSLHADFNDIVKAGQLLAKLDPNTFEAKAQQAAADLDAAKAKLLNNEAAMRKALIIQKYAKRALERQASLQRKGLASGLKLDEAQRDAEVMPAEIEILRANVENAKSLISQKKALLDQALIDLEKTEIRAPTDGIVLDRSVDVGQTVAASFTAPELFRIAVDLSRIHVEAQVNEADIGAVRADNPVSFSVDAYPREKFKARVIQVRLAPEKDKNVVTYTVIIEADNKDRKLFPGMTANVAIETAMRAGVVRLPVDALRFKPSRSVLEQSDLSTDIKTFLQKRIAVARKTLELTDDQVGKLRDVVSEFAKANSRKMPASRANRLFDKILQSLLTDNQREKANAIKIGNVEPETAIVWVLSSSGEPRRGVVQVALANRDHAELTDQSLREGDPVIVRQRKVKKK